MRALANIFKTTNKLDDTKDIPIIQGSYLGKLIQGVLLNPKGCHSSPPLDTPCLVLHVDDSTKMVIPLNTTRPKDLKEMDFAIFAHNLASIVRCLADGTIKMDADNKIEITAPNIVLTGNVLIDGNLTSTAGSELNLGGTGGTAIARVGDQVQIGASTGTIITGSPISKSN